MNFYRKLNPYDTQEQLGVWVVGSGLIGSPIMRLLEQDHYTCEYHNKLAWGNPSLLDSQFCLSNEKTKDPPFKNITVIWAAGAAGFHSSPAECSSEFTDFAVIINKMHNHYRSKRINLRIILISSAGGLFEGQRFIHQNTTPAPIRPYGELKLNQEKFIQSLEGLEHYTLLRLSSVYGKISKTQRMGLIPTMLLNGLRNRVTNIVGRQDTLRDYLYTDQVASAVIKCINWSPNTNAHTLNLSSSKPSAFFEIQQCVEAVIQRKLYINYLSASNSAAISFQGHNPILSTSGDSQRANITKIYHAYMSI